MINIVNPIHLEKISTTRKVDKKKEKNTFKLEKAKENTKQILSKGEFTADNLYFIQEEKGNHYKKKNYDYAKTILDLLSEYRKSVILGNPSLKQLWEIKEMLIFSGPSIGNDKIASVIEEIDILAKVELAKRGMI